MIHAIRHAQEPHGLSKRVTAVVLVACALFLSACPSNLPLPGPEPTAQPVAVATNARFNPTLVLSPPNGYAGIYVQVNGTGWPPNMMVVVVLTDPDGISTTVATKDTERAGTLTTGFLYPIDTRWLRVGPYTVTAESADGQHRATATFTVVEPGTELPPTPAATVTAVASSTATAVPPTATATTLPSPTATWTATPTNTPGNPTPRPITPTPTATAPASPTPQARATAEEPVEDAPVANGQTLLVAAALVPGKERPGPQQQFRVDLTTRDDAREVVAVLQIVPFDKARFTDPDDVKLKDRDKLDIKVDRGKIEINAPDAEALLAQIQQHGGLLVQDGQLIEYRPSPDHRFRAKFENDVWEIEAATLQLEVSALDAAGTAHHITVVAPTNDDTGNQANDNRGRGSDKDDDKDDEDDDNSNSNDNRSRQGRGRGNNHRNDDG